MIVKTTTGTTKSVLQKRQYEAIAEYMKTILTRPRSNAERVKLRDAYLTLALEMDNNNPNMKFREFLEASGINKVR